uniref:Uncharacterized protein n=1 Tax=Anguilla anguilla TaxID=7936 RepID=A0A0E9Q7I4_ANGAN
MVFSHTKCHGCQDRYTPAIALVQSTGLRTGVGPRPPHCGCPLLLSTGFNAEDKLPHGVK